MYYLKHYGFCDGNYLAHHGIKGQKWGKRNGPPYPLSDAKHNKVVKRASKGSKKVSGKAKGWNDWDDDTKAAAIELGLLSVFALGYYAIPAIKNGINNSKANKKAKEKINQRNEKNYDPDTGFYKLNKTPTIEEAAKSVNPRYKQKNATNARSNCVYCSTAYEMRRRGYDVIAKPSTKGREVEIFQDMFPGAKFQFHSADSGLEVVWNKSGTRYKEIKLKDYNEWRSASEKAIVGKNKELSSLTMKELKKEKNSRGQITIGWPYGGGHSISYEVKNSKLTIIDPQNGKVYNTDSEIESFLSHATYAGHYRLDNCDIDPDYIKDLVE